MTIILARSAFLEALEKHDPTSTAIISSNPQGAYTYGQLLQDVARTKVRLLQLTGRNDSTIAGERIAFMVGNGYNYVVTLLAIIAASAVAVPLAPSFPVHELRHIVSDSGALLLYCSTKYAKHGRDVLEGYSDSTTVFGEVETPGEVSNGSSEVQLSASTDPSIGGMMLFTSGTTARPKGVKLSVAALTAQAQSLMEAWKYTPSDHLLHVLPLHHIHGTVNAMLTPLLAGSSIEFLYPFNALPVWNRIAEPFLQQPQKPNGIQTDLAEDEQRAKSPISFFTAVPTIWSRLLQTYASLDAPLQQAAQEAISRKHLRLNISGSAALPKPIRDGWTEISKGNVLLERYGMTETGMTLSCGLEDTDRIENCVGWPLPGVQARLWETDDATGVERVIEHGEEIDPASGKERQGEIQLRGQQIFSEYWNNPSATEKEFTSDGWFKTGDVAFRRNVPGCGQGKSGSWARGPAYFIQGRRSADIIKTGGEKVSALEIERELLSLPQVSECAVIGLPSETWGQKVAAVVVVSEECKSDGAPWGLVEMRRALKERLVNYKTPQDLEIVSEIKRNAMGKVNKKELTPVVFGDVECIRRRSFSAKQKK
ncbi:hypothetical protein DE146DRAFT_525799 [Phaeosphaeria sp. MPI-PUGE-AT-0046c]|nr:hypothetical protein DE146DRAFT_525799 [Phaeosphaeria sp. MPI-PUGE-AT-0046c]